MIIQDVATSNFLSWCTTQGIESSLMLKGSHPYRYVTCQQDLVPDSSTGSSSDKRNRVPLISVPLQACLTGDSQTALADRLTFEKMSGKDSLFSPYLEMLPLGLEEEDENGRKSSLLEMPRFWNDERLASISNFDDGQLTTRLEVDDQNEEEKLVDEWALACVKSRSNFLDDGTYAMTPLLDMMNHDPTVKTKAQVLGRKDKNKEKGFQKDELLLPNGPVLELSSFDRTYSAGDEVFISYGDLTNLETLTNYGFVADDNPCNVECLDVRLILSPDPVRVAVASDGTIAIETLAILRRMLANGNEAKNKSKETLDDFMKPLSENNELEVLSFLATELDMSSKSARRGALEAATIREDRLVTSYLATRAVTFERAIESIKEKYPDLGY